MTDTAQLPYLIKLLDDDDISVRKNVEHELLNFENLEELLAKEEILLNPAQREALNPLLKKNRQRWLFENWGNWYDREVKQQQLEEIFSLVARYQSGIYNPLQIGPMLDQLAREASAFAPRMVPSKLVDYIFSVKKFTPNQHDFYNPLNSNMLHLLDTGLGLPISIAGTLILTAYRLGLEFDGLALPGHFFAQFTIRGSKYLVDPAQKGSIIPAKGIRIVSDAMPVSLNHRFIQKIILEPPEIEQISGRILRNLKLAARKKEDYDEYAFYHDLLKKQQYDFFIRSEAADHEPVFRPGDLVEHVRYGYRGLVVDSDYTCQAEPLWYYSNKTQPEKQQPWYHVLVDGQTTTTYAAESSLQTDNRKLPVEHPLVEKYFEDFTGRGYVRNNVIWDE